MGDIISAEEIEACLLDQKNDVQRDHLLRFFKTGKGEYGEGDEFLGLTNPQTREIVKLSRRKVSLDEIEKLLHSRWHEVRLSGFLLLVEEMLAALPKKRDKEDINKGKRERIADFYLRHARQANNWDLVDLSCPKILGNYLVHDGRNDYSVLFRLSESDNLWEQRIGVVSNWRLIQEGIFAPALEISKRLLTHPHDLIHKAVGWMLREVGKRDKELLEEFLEENYSKIHRTTLRYAIEKFPEPERQSWLKRNLPS